MDQIQPASATASQPIQLTISISWPSLPLTPPRGV
jgi:hypothetical protein